MDITGIPQGSVLGTTLFLVYINDLPDTIDGLVKNFADDTKVYRAIESKDTPELLQNDVGKSKYWGGEWKMLYIDDKFNFREHITTKVNIANRNLGIIFRIFRFIVKEMF